MQAGYVFKNYIFTLSYTYEDNTIESFQTTKIDSITNIVYYSAKNSKYEQYATASVSLPFIVTKWWSMQNNVNVNWRQINAAYDSLPVQVHVLITLQLTQRFTLPKDFSFELTGFYSSATYFGTNKLKPIYQLDSGCKRNLKIKKDIFRLAANDMFNSGGDYVFWRYTHTGHNFQGA